MPVTATYQTSDNSVRGRGYSWRHVRTSRQRRGDAQHRDRRRHAHPSTTASRGAGTC